MKPLDLGAYRAESPGGPVEQIAVTGIAYYNVNLERRGIYDREIGSVCHRSSGGLVGGAAEEEESMDERIVKRVPRMRTIRNIVAEIKALDPGSEVTEYFVRKLVKDGTVKPTWAGNKALINLDDVLDILRTGTIRAQASYPVIDGIRRVDVHMRPGRVGGS